MRTFPFANIDVLLCQHPGVEPDTVARRMLDERQGGCCFGHAQAVEAVADLSLPIDTDTARQLEQVLSATKGTEAGP